jgi:hypothetical protein
MPVQSDMASNYTIINVGGKPDAINIRHEIMQVTTTLRKLADATTIQHIESKNYVFGIAYGL